MSVPIYNISFRQWALEKHGEDVVNLSENEQPRMQLLREYVMAMSEPEDK